MDNISFTLTDFFPLTKKRDTKLKQKPSLIVVHHLAESVLSEVVVTVIFKSIKRVHKEKQSDCCLDILVKIVMEMKKTNMLLNLK